MSSQSTEQVTLLVFLSTSLVDHSPLFMKYLSPFFEKFWIAILAILSVGTSLIAASGQTQVYTNDSFYIWAVFVHIYQLRKCRPNIFEAYVGHFMKHNIHLYASNHACCLSEIHMVNNSRGRKSSAGRLQHNHLLLRLIEKTTELFLSLMSKQFNF